MNRYAKLGFRDKDWDFWSSVPKLSFAVYNLNFNESLFEVIERSNVKNLVPFVQWLPQSINVINPLVFSSDNYIISSIPPEEIASGSIFDNVPLDRNVLRLSSMVSSYGKDLYLGFGNPEDNSPRVPYKEIYQRFSSFFLGGTLADVNARLLLYGLNPVNLEASDLTYFPLPNLTNLKTFFTPHEDYDKEGYYPGDDLVDLLVYSSRRSPEEALDNLYNRYKRADKDVVLFLDPEKDDPRIINDNIYWAKDHDLVGFVSLGNRDLERCRSRMSKLALDNYFLAGKETKKPWIVVKGLTSGQKVKGTFPLRVRAVDDRNISEITCYVNGSKFLSRVTSDKLWINTHEVPKGVCDIIVEAKDDQQNMSLPYRLRVIVQGD